MTETYRIAEKTIRIASLHDAVHRLCADYRAEGDPDLDVRITPEDIAFERGRAEGNWSDAYLETLAVYRRIAEEMPRYSTILLHGSAVAVDGVSYLFAAPSGTGKSTHARLWREVFGERAVMVNDDKPLVRITPEGAAVFGTPWNGKHRLGANISVRLGAVCLLSRAEENSIRPITKNEAYPALIRQIYRPSDPAMLRRTLELTDTLTQVAGLYRLGCNMDPEAAVIAYEGMRGKP